METKLNVYQKLQKARVELQRKKLKKSGYNAFAKFKYYELGDFIPQVNNIFGELGLTSLFNLTDEKAELIIVDAENTQENGVVFTTTLPEKSDLKGANAIQNLGATHTYLKRYLYMNALEIVENDYVDATLCKGNSTQYTSLEEQISKCKTLEDINQILVHKESLNQKLKAQLNDKAKRLNLQYNKDLGKFEAAICVA